MAETILEYLTEMDRVIGDANLIETRVGDDGKLALILDGTIFYPQGGGQVSDTGLIESPGFKFAVESVAYSGGVVLHSGRTLEGGPSIGAKLTLRVNQDRRHYNSCLQSGGHLLLNAMQNAAPSMVATKGYHFPDGPYVEFKGSITEEDRDILLSKLQTEVDRLIALDLPITAQFVPPDELHKICKNVPANVPMDKPTRVVTIDDFSQPCGGTHVRTLGALRGMKVERIRSKKGDTRVSYSIPQQ